MARTPAQRGRTGNWLLESRLARGWDTQTRAREEIQRLTGWLIPQSVYAEWESGRRVPSDANLGRLQQFYGTQEEPATPEGMTGLGALVAALTAQTAAQVEQTRMIGELVSELRAARGLAPELRERVAAIEAYAEEHERRLVADRQRMGLTQTEDSPSGSPQPVGSR